MNQINQLFLLVNLIVNFDQDIATSFKKHDGFFWFHASLDTLDDVLELLVG